MHLWTEYEGRIIAGSYTLGKLLRSEGRNGFFMTADGTGNSAVIRLTEAHFDEDEVLKRWRQVADLHGNNLIEIERVGKTDFDGVALTYALMERNDANLEDVLRERPLTTAETTEVAKSVLAALTTLHKSGLVHEHIEPVNVLAVGEVVKVRSDCVRECVADGEFTSEEACEELRRRDVHDFGILLLRCLTLEREYFPALKLAEPFRRIVPAAIDGHMSLRQIEAILNPAVAPVASSTLVHAAAEAPASFGVPGAVTSQASPRQPLVPEGVRPLAEDSAALPKAVPSTHSPSESVMRGRRSAEDDTPEPGRSAFKPLLLVGALAALLIVFALWHVFSSKPAPAGSQAARPEASAPAVVVAPSPTAAASSSRTPNVGADHAAVAAPTGVNRGPGWYVIAYTYNRQSQAAGKVVRVERRRSGFHPVVFSPSGHGPYLVSLGGPMTESEAEATLRRARRSGMPRDTFIRRY